MTDALPSHARVVVVGGGIAGCSVAYHLTKLGWRDVVLLERRDLSCGTTWHAAGLVGQLRATQNLTRLAKYGADLYERLEAETGQATGFRRPGSVSLARTTERMHELKRLASMARCFGVEVEVITPGEAGRRWPLLRTDDLVGGLWLPRDGRTNPIDTTLALAKGARQGGATILENTAVTAIHRRGGAVAGVSTTRGEVACEVVVNCAGIWARDLGRLAGVTVPLHASEHFYIVTEPMAGVTADLPVLRDPDGYIYVREEVGGLLMGGFEPRAKPWGMSGIPEGFAFSLLPEDWDHFQVMMEQAILRIPVLETAPVRRHVNGPESFTPDGRYHLGEAPECRGFFVVAGFNSVGIASGAGAGKAVAEWIAGGEPPMDLWDVDIRRAAPFQANPRYLHDRTVEMVGRLYAMHWPFQQPETARDVRRSVLHDRLGARGACFGEVLGWERANWYATGGMEPAYRYSWGRQNWFPRAAEEHRAVREAVGLFDQSSFTKLRLEGPDAAAALGRLCAGDVDVPVGRIVYTQMLNRHGGIEADLTVTRLAEEAFLIVTGAAVATHDTDWIRRNLGDARVLLTDVTGASAVLGVMGPRSRALLARLTDADLGNAAFPFLASREMWLAAAPVRASRITYVGELGWELYVPTEFAAGVYDALVAAGEDLGLRHAGYHAMDSLRIEKAYRSWGHDLGSEDTPLEAGLGFAVHFDKPVPFLGRDALLAQRDKPLRRRLVVFSWRRPSRCSTTTSRSGGTARSWGASPRAPTATRSGGPSGSATSSTPTAPPTPSSRRGAGSSRSHASGSRRGRSSRHPTIRRRSASVPSSLLCSLSQREVPRDGFIGGETNQWAPLLYDGMTQVEPSTDPNYHFMTDMTTQAIDWMGYQKSLTPDKPFFIYFAPGATHAPHQVPKAWMAKYKGKFDQGWDTLREETLARQKRLGVVPAETMLAPKPAAIKDWAALTPDEGTPVIEAYKVPFKFTGKIGKVTIELKEMKTADADEAVQARKVAILKKGLAD